MIPHRLLYITDNVFHLHPDEQIVGFFLYDKFKNLIGRIDGLLVESATYLPRYLVITLGGFLMIRGKMILVPREMYEVLDLGKVKTPHQIQWLQDLPAPDDIENVTAVEEERLLGYFDLEPYWAARPRSSD